MLFDPFPTYLEAHSLHERFHVHYGPILCTQRKNEQNHPTLEETQSMTCSKEGG
jgi:hypothetical protein